MRKNIYSIKLYPISEEHLYPIHIIEEGWLLRNRKRMQDKAYKLIKIAENRRRRQEALCRVL